MQIVSSPWALSQAEMDAYDADRAADDAADEVWLAEQEAELEAERRADDRSERRAAGFGLRGVRL